MRFYDKQNTCEHRKLKVGTQTQDRPAYAEPVDVKRGFLVRKTGVVYARRINQFCLQTKGLFAYSRHPNYAAELTIWWLIYGFSIVASGAWINWTIVGVVALTCLFLSSTILTEWIASQKYSAYADYRKKVWMFWPLPF